MQENRPWCMGEPSLVYAYVSPGRAFQPEGQKTASRMENLSGRSVTKKEIPSERPFLGPKDGIFVLCCRCAAASFQPEGPKSALRMENLFQLMYAPAGLFPRKAEKQPFGWNFSFSLLAAAGGCYV